MIRCIRKKTTVYRNVVGSFMDEMSTHYSVVVRLDMITIFPGRPEHTLFCFLGLV